MQYAMTEICKKKKERKEVGHAIRFTAQHIHDPVFLDTIQI